MADPLLMRLRRFLGLCVHEWDTRFWGGYTHGVVCLQCGAIRFRKGPSPQPMPPGVAVKGGGWND